MSDQDGDIEAYLDGEMTAEERRVFEEKLNSDPELKSEVQLHREMRDIYNENDWALADVKSTNSKVAQYEHFLKSEKGKSIADSIKNVEQDYFERKPESSFKRIYYYFGAAAAVVILGLLIFTQLNSTVDLEQLYADNKNWSDLPSLTSRDESTTLATAEKAFRRKEYKEAISLLNIIDDQHEDGVNTQVLLYLGAAHLELNQHKEALNTFKRLGESNSLDAVKAHWYLALTYLKMNNKDEAQQELRLLLDRGGGYKEEAAKNLLDLLK